MSIHRSRIWKAPRDEIVSVINTSNTIAEVLLYFGLENKGGNYKTFINRVEFEGIDISELRERSRKIQSKSIKLHSKELEIPLYDILNNLRPYNRNFLKKRLLKENLIEERCKECGIGNVWNGKILSLQLDHINGDSNDNRLENLRLLCPNCHSQTETFAGKSNRTVKFCQKCGDELKTKKANLCKICSQIGKQRKVDRPSLEELKKLIEVHGYRAVGKMYGVSDNAIRRWLK